MPNDCSAAQEQGRQASDSPNFCDPCATEKAEVNRALASLLLASNNLKNDADQLAQDETLLLIAQHWGPQHLDSSDLAGLLALIKEHDHLVDAVPKDEKVYDAANKRHKDALEKLKACQKAHPGAAGDASLSSATGAARQSGAATSPPSCPASAYATASRDAALIVEAPKLTPLVRKIIRERPTGPAGARQARLDLNRVRQTLQREQRLAKAISAALKPCTSG